MSVGLSTWEKLQNLVAGTTRIYGLLRGGETPYTLTLTDGMQYYKIPFTAHHYTEMTERVPNSQAGRDLFLSPIIERMVKGNILLINDEDSLPPGPDPELGPGPGGISATGVGYNNTNSGLTADNLQAAIDELAARHKAGIAIATDGYVVVDLTATPYTPFPAGSQIVVTANPTGIDANMSCWVEGVSTTGFTLVVSDAAYNGPINWHAIRVL